MSLRCVTVIRASLYIQTESALNGTIRIRNTWEWLGSTIEWSDLRRDGTEVKVRVTRKIPNFCWILLYFRRFFNGTWLLEPVRRAGVGR